MVDIWERGGEWTREGLNVKREQSYVSPALFEQMRTHSAQIC